MGLRKVSETMRIQLKSFSCKRLKKKFTMKPPKVPHVMTLSVEYSSLQHEHYDKDHELFLTEAEKLIAGWKRELASEFEMKDLGLMHYFLGLELWQRSDEIFLSKGKYAIDILRRFGMMDCKSMATPMVTNLKKLSDTASDSDWWLPRCTNSLLDP